MGALNPPALPSLLRSTVRRAAVTGRIYLFAGTGISCFYGVVLGGVSGPSFGSIFPLLLPVVAVVGCLGAMTVFTSDRIKGVFEYLLAYGVSPRTLFFNALVAGMLLETIVLGVTTAVSLSAFALGGNRFTEPLALGLATYAYPMAYASTAFCMALGMIWTTLSTPREGLNSPIGLVPIVGVIPPLGTLLLSAVVSVADPRAIYVATFAPMVAIAIAVAATLGSLDRLLRRERMLSPA